MASVLTAPRVALDSGSSEWFTGGELYTCFMNRSQLDEYIKNVKVRCLSFGVREASRGYNRRRGGKSLRG